MGFQKVVKEGPTGLILTTTAASLHSENETRMFSIPINDTPEQTSRVMKAHAHRYLGSAKRPQIPPEWFALQTWLETAEHRGRHSLQ